ncbi:MAG TPA: response regulator transcription factor [Acetobacteraceae bacterium]|nr:response regulator transcription factor [Acetobacteraceae bacterium]
MTERRTSRWAVEHYGAPDPAISPPFGKSVLLVDPCAMTRQCLMSLLRGHQFKVDAAAYPPDAISADLLLLHIGTERVDAPSIVRRLTALREQCGANSALAVISDLPTFELALAAVRLGLRGYLPTSLSAQMAVAAVELILTGGIFIPAASTLRTDARGPQKLDLRRGVEIITTRENDVLAGLKEGQPNKIIAHGLQISEHTVKVHIRNIMKKLGVTNRTQLAIVARRMTAASEKPISL